MAFIGANCAPDPGRVSALFDRIRAKVARARQHIQELELARNKFLDTKPYAVTAREDVSTRQRIYYLSKAECVPDSLTAIAADVIQNLRSPLDHIVYQLVIAAGGPESERVHYPIRDLAAHYPSARQVIARYVGKEAMEAIDATEPYQGGKGHALWQLNALNNSDKHNLLVGAGSIGAVDVSGTIKNILKKTPRWAHVPVPPLFIRELSLRPLDLGAEVYSEPLDLEAVDNRHFLFDVSFNKPAVLGTEPIVRTLHGMTDMVDDILANLGRFLP